MKQWNEFEVAYWKACGAKMQIKNDLLGVKNTGLISLYEICDAQE